MQSTSRAQGIGDRKNPSLATTAVLCLASGYFLLPLWWLIVSATKSNSALFNSNGFWFSAPQLWENLIKTFTAQGGVFAPWILNSLVYCTSAALLGTLMAAGAGYVLAKFEFSGRAVISGLVLAGVMVPGALLTIPLYFLASSAGLTNTALAIIIPSAVSPFGVYLARIYIESAIDNELLEAARMDGAGEQRIYFQIVLRLITPILVTVFLFVFVSAWNNFMLALVMLNDPSLYPVTLGLYSWQNQKGYSNYDIVLTGALVSIIPLVIAFLTLQKFWRTGLTAGSVKG